MRAGPGCSQGRGMLTVEGRLVCDVIDEQDPHRPAVVGSGDGSKPLLPGRVPNLKFDALPIEVDGSDLEVDSGASNEEVRLGTEGWAGRGRRVAHPIVVMKLVVKESSEHPRTPTFIHPGP